MDVIELIAFLQGYVDRGDGHKTVTAWDGDSMLDLPVTGALVDAVSVNLSTDEP